MNRFSFVAIAAAMIAAGLLIAPMFTEEAADIVPYLPSEPRTERIVDLPEDGDLWQLIIVYADDKRDPVDRQVADMFATTPRLQSLMAQTKVYEYAPSHWWVKGNLEGKRLPAVVLQAVEPAPNNKTAKPIYSVSRENMPATGEIMASEIQTTIETLYPQVKAKRLNRDCPNCPQPNNRPADPRRPSAPRIPDIRPTIGQPGQKGDITTILLLLGGSAAAAYLSAKKN